MLKLIRLIMIGLVLVLASLVTIIVSLFRPFNPSNSTLYCFLSGKAALTLLGLDWKIEGQEHVDGHHPCVYVGNHQSNFDVFITTALVPRRTIAVGKIELIWVPFFGIFFWLAGNILINRSNKNKAIASMKTVQDKLRSNFCSLLIMPEGTRSKGRGLLPFKKGAFHTAAHAGVPIIPICISDWDRFVDLNKWHAGQLIIKVLPPILAKSSHTDDINHLMAHTRAAMEEGLSQINHHISDSLPNAITQG